MPAVPRMLALCSPPSSGFRAVLGSGTGHGGVLCAPPNCPGSLLNPPLLSLLSSLILFQPLQAGVPLLWWQVRAGETQLQPSLHSLAWGPRGLAFPWHHKCQPRLLLHTHTESQATIFPHLETIALIISRSLHSSSVSPIQALFLAHPPGLQVMFRPTMLPCSR